MLPQGWTEKCDTPGSVTAQVPRRWEQFTGGVYTSSDSRSEFSFLEFHECYPCFQCVFESRDTRALRKECERDNGVERTFECDCDKLGLREQNVARDVENSSSTGYHSSAQPFLTGRKKTENSENGIQRCSLHLKKHLDSSSSSPQGFTVLTHFKLTS